MRVVVDSRAWLRKEDLSVEQRYAIRKALTIYPNKVGDYPGDAPAPLELFVEDEERIGVPRQYFLERRKPHHDVEINVTEGDHARWAGPAVFNPDITLRPEQRLGVETIVRKFQGGVFGGVLRASPGWGKCLTISTTYVTEYPSGRRRKLEALVGSEPLVPSVREDGSVVPTRASKIWHEGFKECYEMVLGSGAKLDASYDHPILTSKGWMKIAEIPEGRDVLVATARSLPEPSSPTQVSESEAIVAGLYTADGASLHFGSARYVKGNPSLVELFEKNIPNVKGFTGFGEKKFERGAWYVAPLGTLPWIRDWELDKSSKEKRFPPRAFEMSNEKLALFLRAYLTDGSIYLSKPYKLEISTSSEEMAFELMDAFRRFGLRLSKNFAPKRAKKGGEYFDAWRLQLSDKNSLLAFLDRIGPPFGMEEDCAKLRQILESAKTNTNWDVVPIGHAEIREIRKECLHIPSSEWSKLATGGSWRWMSRERFQRIVETAGYEGVYASYATSDIVWEKVTSVRCIGEREVGDLTVPETGNVVANGIVVHNTVASCAIISEMKVPTLVVVHKDFLLKQWKQRIEEFLPGAEVGIVRGPMCDYTGKSVVIAMVHSLAGEREYPPSLYSWPGLVITDEVHRIGAATWSPVPAMFPAKWRLGISATPRRKDGADNVFFYHLGRLLFGAEEKRMVPKVRRVWTNFRLVKTENFNPSLVSKTLLVRFLTKSRSRNRLIVEQIKKAVQAGRKILVLSERLEHLKTMEHLLQKEMGSNAPTVGQYVGGMSEGERADAEKQQVIFATQQYAAEGLDIPPLDTLFLTTPMSDVEQAVGRILRPHHGKKDPVVVDFRDDKVSKCKRVAEYRDRYYRLLGVDN